MVSAQKPQNSDSRRLIDGFHSNIRVTSAWTFLRVCKNRITLSTLLVSYITFVKLFAEYLNEVAAMNWRQVIFKFQYFDSKGMFISLVYSVPLLFNSIIIVAVWVKRTFSTMTELKTLQLKRKAARQNAKKSQ
uniref:Uncharacterized protein n=1 Tax=Astyanax mexicanus TaxID=7994 RepID=A0A3B1JQ05_ASTMX